jgi:hypothetical protein
MAVARPSGPAGGRWCEPAMTVASIHLEVPQPQEPATPVVPDAPVQPIVPDPGTPADPAEPATVPDQGDRAPASTGSSM